MNDLYGWLEKFFLPLATLVLGGGATAYMFKQKVKSDARGDAVADAASQAEVGVITTLAEQLERERLHSLEKDKVIDRLATERNDAVRSAGMLQGKVESLQTQVNHLSEQVDELQRENEELRQLAIDSNTNVIALKLSIDTLLDNLKVRPCATEPEFPKKDWKP